MYPTPSTAMSKFKANAFGLATSLSKALESVGSSAKNGNHDASDPKTPSSPKLLNNNPSNDPLQSNYNYSPLNLYDDHRDASSSRYSDTSTINLTPTTGNKFGAKDYTPRCMRPKSTSFREVEEEPSSPPPLALTSSTNPFLPSSSVFSTPPFIYNDLGRKAGAPSSAGMYQELQEIKSNQKKEFLETNFEEEEPAGGLLPPKKNYKLNLGIPMVGMVANTELVKINTQNPASPPPQATYPVAAIHPSQAVPLSSIFGLSPPTTPEVIPASSARGVLPTSPPPRPPQPQLLLLPKTPTTSTAVQPDPLAVVNPNSKSTDIF